MPPSARTESSPPTATEPSVSWLSRWASSRA
ncbi:Uncharacterised protein [Mycobacteroides abscessus]|nr:Uncharacterised protein [Mycobacteroides abscessus]